MSRFDGSVQDVSHNRLKITTGPGPTWFAGALTVMRNLRAGSAGADTRHRKSRGGAAAADNRMINLEGNQTGSRDAGGGVDDGETPRLLNRDRGAAGGVDGADGAVWGGGCCYVDQLVKAELSGTERGWVRMGEARTRAQEVCG